MVDARDGSGSTSLHKACANGHASSTRLLLSRGARHLDNGSENTPLHWAAGAGHAECVGLLLDHFDALHYLRRNSRGEGGGGGDDGTAGGDDASDDDVRLDVLRKNGFGRSALTEGFASGDAKTVELLLNHDSAEEEKLIGGLNREEVDEEEANNVAAAKAKGDGEEEDEKKKNGIVHEFDFLRSTKGEGQIEGKGTTTPTVYIRELVSIFVCLCCRTMCIILE